VSRLLNEPVEGRIIGSLPDEAGHFGPYGGVFIAETLMGPVEALRQAYERYLKDPEFLAELDADLRFWPSWMRICATT